MSRHARPVSGRGGSWFVALAFVILVVGAYLANAADSNTQRPAIGLAALAAAGLALVSARAERHTQQRIDELIEARRRDSWRLRSELDEAHARSHRALQRAIAAETAVHTLIAATENLLQARQALVAAATPSATPSAAPAALPTSMPARPPATAPLPLPPLAPAAAADTRVPAARPAPAFVPAFVPSLGEPIAPAAQSAPAAQPQDVPAAAAATLIWPLADLPAQQREPSLDLPLVPAPGSRIPPVFVPVESARRSGGPSTTTGGRTEPQGPTELVDITSTSTRRYARPA